MGSIRAAVSVAAMLAATSALAGSAAVPNTFSDGQVISSSQMNANFSAVLGYINTLNNSVLVQPLPSIMVNQNPQSPGTTVTVDGVNYTIIRVSVPAFASDTRVWLDYPSQVVVSPPPSSTTSVSVQVQAYGRFPGQGLAIGASGDAFTTTINGLTVNCNEAYNYSIDGSITNPTVSPTVSVSGSYTQYLSCVANVDSLTQLSLYFWYVGAGQQLSAGSPVPEDLSGNDPYSNGVTPLSARRSQIQADLRALLQYVVFSPGH